MGTIPFGGRSLVICRLGLVGLITLRTWAHAQIIRLTQLPSLKGPAFRAGITNEFAKHKFLGDTHLRTRLSNLSHPSLRKHSLPQGTLSIFVSNNQSPANLISLFLFCLRQLRAQFEAKIQLLCNPLINAFAPFSQFPLPADTLSFEGTF